MAIDTRFARLELALGLEAVRRLLRSTVAVVGIGGVGGIAVETLVRSAVGHVILIDSDHFQRTDINRQVFALESTVGRPKVAVAADRLRDIHPGVRITAYEAFFEVETAERLLALQPDAVIDAIDTVPSKIALIVYCHERGIPVISVMGAALRTDYSRITVTDISRTSGCPLAR
ncbi:ThiF family adenylyltransferase, partial [bacterium]|nr:ThiF family adenylyltransferase [candidate division CSSED10-310 bacterium]